MTSNPSEDPNRDASQGEGGMRSVSARSAPAVDRANHEHVTGTGKGHNPIDGNGLDMVSAEQPVDDIAYLNAVRGRAETESVECEHDFRECIR